MSRLDQDNDVLSMVYELEKQANEIKGLQQVGSDAVRTHKLGTPATWDRDVTTDAAQGNDITEAFTIRYVPENPIEGKSPAAFSVVSARLVTGDYERISALQTNAWYSVSRKKVVDPLVQEWNVSIRFASGYGVPIRWRIKFYVLATGSGTVSIV